MTPFDDDHDIDRQTGEIVPIRRPGLGHNSGVRPDFRITEDQVAESLYWLASNAERAGLARGMAKAAEERRKIRKSEARLKAKHAHAAKRLSAADLDDLAYTDYEYMQFIDTEFSDAFAVDRTVEVEKAFHEARILMWHQQMKMAQSKGNVR